MTLRKEPLPVFRLADNRTRFYISLVALLSSHPRWQTDGKFFRSGSVRIRPRMVTYGPFPGGWPSSFNEDFRRIAEAGFSAIRLYSLPDRRMLHAAIEAGLRVFAGLNWQQNSDFLSGGSRFSKAHIQLAGWLRETGRHPALAGLYVGNEIPADLVRWMGPLRVQSALEELIASGRQIAPHLLFAYTNFPSTEYLEPGNADFTAFNVYLEKEQALENYIRRLHHIAGDRPLVLSEFGLDSHRNGLDRQTKLLQEAARICDTHSVAGYTVFAWSDRWLSGGLEVSDWDFGLTDRKGKAKPALAALRQSAADSSDHPSPSGKPRITAIICTRNGRTRIGHCLNALGKSTCPSGFETIVVDDGSTDGTPEWVEQECPEIRLIRMSPSGLSAARNRGARAATTEFLAFTDDDCEPDIEWLQRTTAFLESHSQYVAVGGPNLPQCPRQWREAVVCAAPGAPSHVLLDDTTAEHLPGCNLVVRSSALEKVEGFDEQFHTAGDDVDFCWRLQDAGLKLGFDPGAFVWHWRRPSLRAYLRQQIGYGKAERMLIQKHPQRFGKDGSAVWKGRIYNGAPVRVGKEAIIYHGTVAENLYRPEMNATQPVRGLDARFNGPQSRLALAVVGRLAHALRGWFRTKSILILSRRPPATKHIGEGTNTEHRIVNGTHRDELVSSLLDAGWHAYRGHGDWDLEKLETRVLIATELGDQGTKRSLVRISGDSSLLRSDS